MGVVTHRTDAGRDDPRHGVEARRRGDRRRATARAGDRVMAKLARLLSRVLPPHRRRGHRAHACRPTVLVANHVNGLVDGLVLMATLPRYPRFLGKTTLYRILPLAPFLHLAGVVPVHRTKDAGATGRRRAQRRRLRPAGRCWPAVASWRCSPKASATSEGAAAAPAQPASFGAVSTTGCPASRPSPSASSTTTRPAPLQGARPHRRAGGDREPARRVRASIRSVRSGLSPTTSVASSRRWRRCTSHVSRSWPGGSPAWSPTLRPGRTIALRWARPSPTDRRRQRSDCASRTPPRPTRPTSRWWAWSDDDVAVGGRRAGTGGTSVARSSPRRHGHRWPRRGGRPRGALRHHEAGRAAGQRGHAGHGEAARLHGPLYWRSTPRPASSSAAGVGSWPAWAPSSSAPAGT